MGTTKHQPMKVSHSEVIYEKRPLSGASTVDMGWSIPMDERSALLAGFAYWDGDDSPFKTLNYEEVLLVLEGSFGFELEDGTKLEGSTGDTLRLPYGSRIKYFGRNAKIFFVITPPS